jgi:hypothetical protein
MGDSDYANPLPPTLSGGLYVRVATTDEWEDLIGIIEEFLDSNLDPIDEPQQGGKCLVYFPISRRAQQSCNLAGVNDYPETVLNDLRGCNSRKVFDLADLQEFDPNNI